MSFRVVTKMRIPLNLTPLRSAAKNIIPDPDGDSEEEEAEQSLTDGSHDGDEMADRSPATRADAEADSPDSQAEKSGPAALRGGAGDEMTREVQDHREMESHANGNPSEIPPPDHTQLPTMQMMRGNPPAVIHNPAMMPAAVMMHNPAFANALNPYGAPIHGQPFAHFQNPALAQFQDPNAVNPAVAAAVAAAQFQHAAAFNHASMSLVQSMHPPEPEILTPEEIARREEVEARRQKDAAYLERSRREKKREEALVGIVVENKLKSTTASFQEDYLADLIRSTLCNQEEGLDISAVRCAG